MLFDPASPEVEATFSLLNLAQGSRSVIDYIIEFRTLAADSAWNDAALYDTFYGGLAEQLKDTLASQAKPKTLKDLFEAITRLDGRYRERQLERSRTFRSSGPYSRLPRPLAVRRPVAETRPPTQASYDSPEPMQLGRSRLSPEEHEQGFRLNLCLYCGGPGHHTLSCPAKDWAQHRVGERC